MNGKAKSLFKIVIWAFILIILVPLPIINFLGTSFRDEVIWYYLLLALPFLIYLLIGWAQKMNRGKKSSLLILIVAPIISVISSVIYIALEGSAGYQFGPLPIIMLMAGIHFLLGMFLSAIFYFRG